MKASNFTIEEWLFSLFHKGMDFLLPPRCTGCSVKVADHGVLCSDCWLTLQPLSAPFCQRCALPFEFSGTPEDVCASCLVSPSDYDWARAAVLYDGLGKSLVLQLKHGGNSAVVPVMARMMATALADKKPDLIVPVPLHRKRFLGRRFNQSILLARATADRVGCPVDPFSLVKTKATESQGGLNRKQRLKNVRGVFRVEKERAALLEGKHILLVDDVLTTGATAGACALALKKAGAEQVGLVTFARVGQPLKG